VHVGSARPKIRRLSALRTAFSGGLTCILALLTLLCGSKALQNASAEGDTRTISLHHIHTGEDITITFKRDGRYDDAALEKLNWFLRDWRKSQQTRMDPHLIDLIWEVQREAAPNTPVEVVCGYRSPETNAMLRHRSARSGVARFSQHMLGHAMDFYIPGVPLEQLREIGLRLQRGGVGFYPESGSPFVHMDTGGVRMWPRMTHEQLARVFPDGRTVLIPADGKPLSGYALALADLHKHGSAPSENSIVAARNAGVSIDATLLASNERPAANPFARLLGLAKDEDDEDDATSASSAPAAVAAAPAPKHPVIAAIEHGIARGAQTAGKATAKAAVKVADAAAKVKFIRTADAAPAQASIPSASVPATARVQAAPIRPAVLASIGSTPNQVIAARGYWQGPADATAAATSLVAQRSRMATKTAPTTTGSIGPFVDPRDDQTAGLTLAYAEQPDQAAADRTAMGIAALRAAALAQQAQQAQVKPAAVMSTTIAVKRAASQIASAVITASATSLTVIKAADARFANPWLRAIVLSPSVHRFLTTAALGARDFRSLAALMVKPKSSVLMSFAADPNPGLDHDRFSGTAIVFVATVTYPTHTASLQ
jgi:uncharacterized protein YcbK (DUF882 family)